MLMATDDQTGQHLEDIYIADKVVGLLMAGLDPSTTVITSLVRYLSELPHIYNQVLKEHMEIVKSKKPRELLNWNDIKKMKYSSNVACEVMRLSPPSQGSFREALYDFNFLFLFSIFSVVLERAFNTQEF
ncbi:hypothetical protein ACOSP7_030414 [Xanthoceras sorbifolium]